MSVQSHVTLTSPSTEAAVARNTALLDAMVAAYALMAHADGEAALAERRRMFAILRELPVMSVFARDDIAGDMAEHEANFRYDPELAQQIAREKLVGVVGDAHAVHQVVTAARDLIAADGVAHPAEYRTLAEIKDLLGHADAAPRIVSRQGSSVRPAR